MKQYSPFLALIIVILTVFYSYYSLTPHRISNASTSLTEFSTERALKPLKEISKKAHYLGSKEHKNVREYIVSELEKMGLETTVETQQIFSSYGTGAKINNIIATIKGTNNTKALMLSTHYDSDTSASLGASDAGSGVVTILEGIRAYLASGKKPKNDIIILITDAEELGLLGAKAYRKTHNIEEVGMILVFEARGSGGPSYTLIETNGGNKNLIKELKKAQPTYPVATSLMYSIYKMLPNSTDLTAFKEDAPVNGFGFAFIGDHFDYHTPQDSYNRLDRTSLEHQASYLMPLLHYFADADLSNLNSKEDYVYFNFPFFNIIYYPFSFAIPIALIISLLFTAITIFGIKKKKLNTKELLKGFIPFLVALASTGIITKYGWELLKIIYPQYNDIKQGFTYNGYTYIIAFVALTLSICFFSYKKYFDKNEPKNLLIAPTLIWILLNIGVAIYLKGASYFIISVIFGLISLSILLFLKTTKEKKLLLITFLSLPVLIIFSPNVKMFPSGLGLDLLIAGMLVVVLLFGILVPILSSFKKFKLHWITLGIALIGFITASFQSSYTVDRKKPNGINYIVNINDNKAFWASTDNSLDEFTQQFFSDTITKLPKKYYKFYEKTTVKSFKQPTLTVIKDTIVDNERQINFSITSHRGANLIRMFAQNEFIIKNLKIQGYEFPKRENKDYVQNTKYKKWLTSYNFAYQDSILNVELIVLPNDRPKISVSEVTYDLLKNPNFNIKPRKDYMMVNSYPNDVVDAIILVKEFEF
ncbi:M28 family peptidase [Tenacibaculum amylolyticum]|uniref:M28 family peptidase n=1 Tax=Tenacibaculum amylolyticum TaxID=104269 RepID=UPI0038963F2A